MRIALPLGKNDEEELDDRRSFFYALRELFRIFRDEICRIFPNRKPHRFHPKSRAKRSDCRLRGGRKTGGICIKAKHQVFAVALHEREMLLGERGTRERYRILKTGLMRMNGVHLPFHKEGETARADRILRAVHSKQDVGLVVELGFRAIEIFRLLLGRERTARKCNDATGAVAYREHETIPEAVVPGARLPICLFYESHCCKLGLRKALERQRLKKRSPAVGRKAYPPRLDRLIREAALLCVGVAGTV